MSLASTMASWLSAHSTPENFAYLTNRFHEVIAAARGEANLLFQVPFNVRESSMALLHL